MRVATYMRCHVFTLTEEASLEEAARAFEMYQQPVLPVVDESERLVGTVTPWHLAEHLARRDALAISTGRTSDLSLGAVVGRLVLTCSPEDDIAYAAGLLRASREPAVVVLEGDHVVGILGWPEVCWALAEGPLVPSGPG